MTRKFISATKIPSHMVQRDTIVLDIEKHFWELIVNNEKTYEIRKRDLQNVKKIVFLDNKTFEPLGIVEISGVKYSDTNNANFDIFLNDLILVERDFNKEFIAEYLGNATQISVLSFSCIYEVIEIDDTGVKK